MTKSNDLIADTVRDSKHPFRAVADRPKKSQKHRYERRKVRGYLRDTDWSEDSAPI